MSALPAILDYTSQNFTPPVALASWYAIQTRSRHERVVAHQLQIRGVTQYLPTVTEVHRWSDRRKQVEVPLFAGYLFVQLPACNQNRVQVLHTPGVLRFVGSEPGGSVIPDDQLESIRALVDRDVPWAAHPFLKSGQRVRVRGGSLDGLEGIFMRRSGEDSLIISIDAIQRSLCVSIQGYELEVL